MNLTGGCSSCLAGKERRGIDLVWCNACMYMGCGCTPMCCVVIEVCSRHASLAHTQMRWALPPFQPGVHSCISCTANWRSVKSMLMLHCLGSFRGIVEWPTVGRLAVCQRMRC